MDRPLGPRQPDKRHAAFQDIFGRAGPGGPAAAPAAPAPSQHPPQPAYAASVHGGYYAHQPPPQPAYAVYDRHDHHQPHHHPHLQQQQQQQPPQPPYNAGYAHSVYAAPPPPVQPTYSQAYYAGQPPQSYYPPPQAGYAGQQPYPPGYLSPQGGAAQSLAPPSMVARPRSVASSRHAPGTIVPQPEEPPDPALEALMRQGMTPAQAYQYHVYHGAASAAGMHGAATPQVHSPPLALSPPVPPPAAQQPPALQAYDSGLDHPAPPADTPPKLGLNWESDHGRLSLDFTGGDENGSSAAETEDSFGGKRDDRQPAIADPRHTPKRRPSGARPRNTLLVDTALPAVSYSPATPSTSQLSHTTSTTSASTSTTATTATSASTAPSSSTTFGDLGPAATRAAAADHRRSAESTRTMPGLAVAATVTGTSGGGGSRRERTHGDRARSMSAAMTTPSIRSLFDPTASARTSTGSTSALVAANRASGSGYPTSSSPVSARHSNGAVHAASAARPRAPIVYPALLSRVAQAFRDRIALVDRVKDGLTYSDAFDGREAVDKIAYIIKTTDRNLALLLGRALDAQKFFHDVTYDHRLRDSAQELYQFRTSLPSPFGSADAVNGNGNGAGAGGAAVRPSLVEAGSGGESSILTQDTASTPSVEPSVDSHDGSGSGGDHAPAGGADGAPASPLTPTARARPKSDAQDDDADVLPSGVFTLLTDCYSPTCSRDRLCYSIACPRRLEQQARLNMKPQPGLKKDMDTTADHMVEPGTLWIHSVSKEIADSVSDTEKRRQEAINEVMYTERDFVRDMEYLRDQWINPLKAAPDILPEARRTDFLEQVFWNIHDIIAVNTRLRDALTKRQRHYAVVEQVGDILLDAVPHFSPFVSYGAHQLYGKYEFEKEKSSNPAFAAFVDTTERLPESRKLELNGYLTKPTTRLARYPLLLEAVLKHTPDDNPDKQTLPQVIALVREFLGRVNTESGKTENRFNLLQLDQQLVFRPGEQVDLRLQEEGRELIYKGALKKRGGTTQGDSGDLLVFLFDHALLMVKQKTKHEQYKVYRRPIPLELLVVSAPDDGAASSTIKKKGTVLARSATARNVPHPPVVPLKLDSSKGGFALTFVHLGRKYYQMTLWASTYVSQRKWVDGILKQQEIMRERSTVFETELMTEGFFVGLNRVNCAAPFNGGRRILYGTDDGVYLSDLNERGRDPMKVVALLDVTQVDVLEEYQLLVVLSERQVLTFPLDALDPHDPMAALKRAKRISSHTSFFKAGYCLGKAVVCVVKSSPLSSTIKTLEPIDQNVRGRSKPTFKKLLQGGNDTLRVFREFYIPVESSSVHFLKARLCVGCTKGFEIVDLETLDTQSLLDPADESLEFVSRRDNPPKPMAIYRVDSEFLLCYDEFAFYINRNGWRSRKDFMVHWEGSPTGFAMHYPYVLAFEPMFVEIRHVETGAMVQIIQGNNLRLLFADIPPSTTHSSAMNAQAQYNQFGQQQQYNYNPYSSPQNSVSSRQSGHSGQSTYGGNAQYPTPNPYQQPQRPGFGRTEIIMVSDDRVLTVRMVNDHPLPPVPSDAGSAYSVAMR